MLNKKTLMVFLLPVVLLISRICMGAEGTTQSHPAMYEFLLYLLMFGVAGIIILIGGYYIWELITPYNVKQQLIEYKNTAVAIVVAAFIIGMAIIIAGALILIK